MYKYEYLGIIGTALILIGFLSNDQRKIRVFDALGSVLFVMYGMTIGSISTITLNSVLVVVQILKLARQRR